MLNVVALRERPFSKSDLSRATQRAFIGILLFLEWTESASALGERDTIGSASAHAYAADLHEQWEAIVADLDLRDVTQAHHCWPHAHPGGDPGASTVPDPRFHVSEPSRFTFNLTEADLVAELQTTVYCDRTRVRAWNCTRCAGTASTFALHKLVFMEEWDVTAMVGHWPLLDAVFVTFRGTDSHNLGNWITDMDMRMSDYPVPRPRAQQQQRHAAAEDESAHDTSTIFGEDGAGAFVGGAGRDAVDEESPRVHTGFLRSLLESNLYDGVRDALRSLHAALGSSQHRLYVTGHSLGAAMAAMAAPMLLHDFAPPEIRLYTFGSPRTGNQAFVDLVMDSVDYSIRFTHDYDIVPSLPPPFFGFHHFPREVWQLDLTAGSLAGEQLQGGADRPGSGGHLDSFVLHPGQPSELQDSGLDNLQFVCRREGSASEELFDFRICDGSGEDPQCHDSVCYWAPCHSLQDHIFYLGKHMYHRVGEC